MVLYMRPWLKALFPIPLRTSAKPQRRYGGSNRSRVRLFKVEIQKLADETGLTLQGCHYPPRTSNCNNIEHKLCCHITQAWRGKPLTSRETVVEPIASTTTRSGLTVR